MENGEIVKAIESLPVDMPGVASLKSVAEVIDDYCNLLGDGRRPYLGIETGWEELDGVLSGLNGVIVLGGIAGIGKTSFTLYLGYNIARSGTPVLFYSLEMGRRDIITKLIARLASIEYSRILTEGQRMLNADDEEGERLRVAINDLRDNGKMFYLRTRERGQEPITIENIEGEIAWVKHKSNSERVLVIVDHLQVLTPGDYKDQLDKENKLIVGFKEIQERTGAVVLLISQKNKAGFTAKDLQAIKGSVDIVYLADVVMFLEFDKAEENMMGIEPNRSDIILNLEIKKNRYGPVGRLKLRFYGAYGWFKGV